MRVDIEDWKNGWLGIDIGIRQDEINRLIDLLRVLERKPDQHFHISSDYEGTGGIGNIRVSVLPTDVDSNMHLTSRAYAPGEVIDEQ